MSKQLSSPFRHVECCICGKDFGKIPGSIYTVTFAGKQCHCCSYTCYQKAQKAKEEHNSSQYAKMRRSVEGDKE